MLFNLFSRVNITKIDQDRVLHNVFQSPQIENSKLIPFRDNNDGIGLVRSLIGTICILNIFEYFAGVFDTLRIICDNLGSCIEQSLDVSDTLPPIFSLDLNTCIPRRIGQSRAGRIRALRQAVERQASQIAVVALALKLRPIINLI